MLSNYASIPALWQTVEWLNMSQPLNLNKEMLPLEGFPIEERLSYCLTNGVPQGSPCSPLLSLIGLEEFMKGKQTLMYADDGL